MPRTGTEKVIGFLMKSQRPYDEHFLNEGVAWANTDEALAGIPTGSRSPGKLLLIGTILYWFKADLTTLEPVAISSIQTASDVSITDPSGLFDATNVVAALAEVMGYANSLGLEITAIGSVKQNSWPVNLGAFSSVAGRVGAAVVTTNYPTGWTIAASGGTNLLITHNLTGRKCSGVNVFEIDGANERLLPNFSAAYTGILLNASTVLIEGLAPTPLAIRIELMFD